jgi:hypothetical protein
MVFEKGEKLMYDELVKRLREPCQYENCILCQQAADAIEELQKRVLLAPIDSYAGLKRKYIVLKADTGEDVPDCFVLRPAKDKAAVEALRAYAKATDNDLLAADIYRWVGPLPEPPKEES